MRRFPTIAMAAVLATALVAASPAVAKKKDNGDGGSTPPAVEPASKPEKPGKDDGITLLTQDCDLLDGCRFSGNDKDAAAIEAAYEEFFPSEDLELDFVVKFEFNDGFYSGTWTSPTPVSFLSVKAGNEFTLYKLETPVTSGSFTTLGLTNRQGIQQAVSHISLWGSDTVVSVPEPATWALMLLGFGGIGALLRRRRGVALA